MINEKWNAWILAYGPDNQESFMEWLGMDEPNLRKMLLTLVGRALRGGPRRRSRRQR